MLPYLRDGAGNPSSIHAAGQTARAAIEDARVQVADALGASAREIVFTSGGSEANNLAIRGTVDRHGRPDSTLVVSAIEHDAVLACAEALDHAGRVRTTVVPCDHLARVDGEAVAAAVDADTLLVSVMLANNEVGTVQELPAIVEAVRRRSPRALIHCDAVQALGRIPVHVDDLGVDLLTISGHKVSGPQGIGALYVRHGITIAAQIAGGGQERNRRSGTENVAAIVGLGAAVTLAMAERDGESVRLRALADRLTRQIVENVTGVAVTGDPRRRLPHLVSLVVADVRTDVLLAALDGLGVCASGGSACASGAPVPSRVLRACGIDDGAALRLSLGRTTTAAMIDAAAAAVVTAIGDLRRRAR